jgi:hypothetical protein
LVLAATMALTAAQIRAQQDEGPILRPKPKPAATATLLVMCDLACNWKLDGEAKGRIEAGGSAKAKVELGQHVVSAATEDGLDQVEKELDIEAAKQTLVRMELAPVREARLKAEQQRRSNEALNQQEKDRRELAAKETAARIWTDPVTQLTWTRKDNGYDVNWNEAVSYCQSLVLDGHSDWRLPSIEELRSIYDHATPYQPPGQPTEMIMYIKGGITPTSGNQWSATQTDGYGTPGSGARYVNFWQGWLGEQAPWAPIESRAFAQRALCVRRSGE